MSEKKPTKPGVGKKLASEFIQKDLKDIGDYILHDKLLPAMKKGILDFGCAIFDGFKGSFSMLLYGDERPITNNRVGQVSYNSMYNNQKPVEHKRVNAGYGFKIITFETRSEADEKLHAMMDILAEYHCVTVNDYYELVGEGTGNYASNNYGWKDLSTASVSVSPDGGFQINLPKAVPLNA